MNLKSKRKGNVILLTLLALVLVGIAIIEIKVARLNLTNNLTSSEVLEDADVALRLTIDNANDSMKEEFFPKNFDYSGQYTYLQAEYIPITLDKAADLNREYALEGHDIKIEFIPDAYGTLSSINIEYPKFGTDYLNYFTVDTSNNLASNRVNSNYLSKSQALKTYNQNFSVSSKPLIYKNNILSNQYSYDISTSNLKRALYLDMPENKDIYNIKYPKYEKGISKKINNTEYIKTTVELPQHFKEVYMVFCNENNPLPTGLFSSDYNYVQDIITDDVRDNIRRDHSYIRIYKNNNEVTVEYSLPIFESTLQNSVKIDSNSNYTVTNLKADINKALSQIVVKDNILNTSTSDKVESFPTDTLSAIMGEVTLCSSSRVRQYYTSDNLPNQIIYTIKVPAKREYMLKYRIFNKKNILVRKQEYILEVR
ncbi:hypothetical protein [Clostridium tertium]|uniref:hypothetical protein n=1 Tax=Clostridium tertium TaxID=1559 RepID=UPI0023B25DC9|nr:hypothetical protein [Clostridium tertium]